MRYIITPTCIAMCTLLLISTHSFLHSPSYIKHPLTLLCSTKNDGPNLTNNYDLNRRTFVTTLSTVLVTFPPLLVMAADDLKSISDILPLVKEARSQLDAVQPLIQTEKWDTIRAILSTPPLNDCWSKTQRPFLRSYAEAIGNELPNGDELAALEEKEEIVSHLRFLDMAAYNNVFNPITAEGKSGASKELIRSYYEDPKLELAASKKALDNIILLSGK